RDEERAASGPAVGLWLLRQRVPTAGAYLGLCHRGAVSGGSGGRAGSGHGDGEHVAAALVEGGRGSGDGGATDLVPRVGELARPDGVGSTTVGRALVGGAVARRGAAPAPGAGRAAHVRFLRRSKQPSGCGRPSSVPRADKRSADSCTTAVCCG